VGPACRDCSGFGYAFGVSGWNRGWRLHFVVLNKRMERRATFSRKKSGLLKRDTMKKFRLALGFVLTIAAFTVVNGSVPIPNFR
jgi:hypothetical protein